MRLRVMTGLLLSAALCAQIAAAEPVETAAPAGSNRELADIYNADQGDRRAGKIDWAVVTPRDQQRQARVRELAASGALKTSADFHHAAMVYQHGSTPEFYKQAQLWAQRAVELDAGNDGARWLAAAAEDRYLINTGKPQIWGTQYTKPHPAKEWTMEPFDRQAKTDAERIAQKVQTLAQSQARLDSMNATLKQP
ncbi:MAG TPA: hypothetical protein VIT92_11135 [Burkholderiaceae bacterium]